MGGLLQPPHSGLAATKHLKHLKLNPSAATATGTGHRGCGEGKSQHQLLQGSTEEAAASTLKSKVSPAAKAPVPHPIPRISPLSTRLSPVLLEHDALSREPEEELEQRFPARSGVKPGKVPTRDP